MFGIDWNDLQLFHWFAIGGGVVLVLALLLYLIPGEARKSLRIPAIVFGVVGGMALGFAAGALGMAYYRKDSTTQKEDDKKEDDKAQARPGPGGRPPGGRPPGGRPPGGGAFPGGGGGGNFAKPQLALLVRKLDLLTSGKPLTIKLSQEQKKKVLEQLKGLDQKKLTDDDAAEKLEELQKSLKDDKDTLEAVGFLWREPGQGGGGPGGGGPGGGLPGGGPPGGGPPGGGPGGQRDPDANPFKEKRNAEPLNALKERLEKKDGK